MRAVDAGDAQTIVLLSGDHFGADDFKQLVDNYNRTTAQYLAGIPTGGPNALFAMLTRQQMDAHGLERADYGRLAVAQRRWAGLNPGAVYREPITLDDYLAAPVVADPLHRLDCVPVVSGADALVVTAGGQGGVGIRALRGLSQPRRAGGRRPEHRHRRARRRPLAGRGRGPGRRRSPL